MKFAARGLLGRAIEDYEANVRIAKRRGGYTKDKSAILQSGYRSERQGLNVITVNPNIDAGGNITIDNNIDVDFHGLCVKLEREPLSKHRKEKKKLASFHRP